MNSAILIPAYQPSEILVKLVREILSGPFETIVIVNDGSDPDKKALFDRLRDLSSKIVVLEHAVNLGKGAALKTGFNYLLLTFPGISTIVTADADGQHKVTDIIKVLEMAVSKSNSLIIGARAFIGYVPLRSKFGNALTKKVFWFFSGLSLGDTQSGLRAIPLFLARRMMTIPSNGYEFEMEMLVNAGRWKIPIQETPIETIYETGNTSSHFNPFKDSMRIYFVFVRYTLSSIASFLVDYVLFLLIYGVLRNVFYATYLARSVSMVVNFNLNKRAVFKSGNKVTVAFVGYLILVILSAVASAFLTNGLFKYLEMPLPVAKIVADTLLYFLNFAVQREIIFNRAVEE